MNFMNKRGKLTGITSSTKRIKENKELALWRDITQTNTNRYPKGVYTGVMNYMENNYIFKAGDIGLIRKRYGEAMEYGEIGRTLGTTSENIRTKVLRILRELSQNRRAYAGNVFIQTTPKNKNKKPASNNWAHLNDTPVYKEKVASDHITISEYAKRIKYSYGYVAKVVQKHRAEIKGFYYLVKSSGRGSRTIYLTPDATQILDKYLTHPYGKVKAPQKPKAAAVEKVTQNNDDTVVEADAKMLLNIVKANNLTMRATIAAAMSNEDNPEYKEEYFKVLKDLNVQEGGTE